MPSLPLIEPFQREEQQEKTVELIAIHQQGSPAAFEQLTFRVTIMRSRGYLKHCAHYEPANN